MELSVANALLGAVRMQLPGRSGQIQLKPTWELATATCCVRDGPELLSVSAADRGRNSGTRRLWRKVAKAAWPPCGCEGSRSRSSLLLRCLAPRRGGCLEEDSAGPYPEADTPGAASPPEWGGHCPRRGLHHGGAVALSIEWVWAACSGSQKHANRHIAAIQAENAGTLGQCCAAAGAACVRMDGAADRDMGDGSLLLSTLDGTRAPRRRARAATWTERTDSAYTDLGAVDSNLVRARRPELLNISAADRCRQRGQLRLWRSGKEDGTSWACGHL